MLHCFVVFSFVFAVLLFYCAIVKYSFPAFTALQRYVLVFFFFFLSLLMLSWHFKLKTTAGTLFIAFVFHHL